VRECRKKLCTVNRGRPYKKRALQVGGPKQGREDKEGKEDQLPAVAAVATITSISAAASTTTAAAVATASAATAAVPSATTTAAGAFRLRARFIDHKVPTTEVLTVEAIDRAIGVFIAGNFDEGEAA
jgi:hypothetical protein